MRRGFVAIGVAGLLLAACEMKVGGDGEAGGNASAPANGAVRDGQISIDTPGFDMKLDIPQALRSKIDGDGALIYPGATMNGLNVTATGNEGAGQGRVEMRFSTPDAIAQVANWYRDPARAAAGLTGVSVRQDGGGFRISGAGANGGDPFDLRLTPAPGGGTQAQLVMRGSG